MNLQNLNGVRIALCGGAGFTGTHLALALKQHGADIHVVDGFVVNHIARWVAEDSPYRERYLGFLNERLRLLREAGIPIHACDLRDYHATSRVLAQVAPQKIVHLAAVSHAGKSNKNRHEAFDHGINTLKSVLDYACGAKVEQFVFQSSSMRYGHIQGRATEDDLLRPIGWYGALKVAAERMVIAAYQVEELPYTITCPSALYGPLCVSRRVIQVFIEAALQGQPLRVAGDGQERLDFTYIQDWVQGMVLILSKSEALNQTFNLAYGDARPLNDLVHLLQFHFPDVKVEYSERDSLMPLRDTLDVTKAYKLLGYAPEYPLEWGLSEYISWHKRERSV